MPLHSLNTCNSGHNSRFHHNNRPTCNLTNKRRLCNNRSRRIRHRLSNSLQHSDRTNKLEPLNNHCLASTRDYHTFRFHKLTQTDILRLFRTKQDLRIGRHNTLNRPHNPKLPYKARDFHIGRAYKRRRPGSLVLFDKRWFRDRYLKDS